MKNIFELLEGIGLTVPEEQKTAFETAFGENYKAIADYNKAVKKRDEYKAALDEKRRQRDLSLFERTDHRPERPACSRRPRQSRP